MKPVTESGKYIYSEVKAMFNGEYPNDNVSADYLYYLTKAIWDVAGDHPDAHGCQPRLLLSGHNICAQSEFVRVLGWFLNQYGFQSIHTLTDTNTLTDDLTKIGPEKHPSIIVINDDDVHLVSEHLPVLNSVCLKGRLPFTDKKSFKKDVVIITTSYARSSIHFSEDFSQDSSTPVSYLARAVDYVLGTVSARPLQCAYNSTQPTKSYEDPRELQQRLAETQRKMLDKASSLTQSSNDKSVSEAYAYINSALQMNYLFHTK